MLLVHLMKAHERRCDAIPFAVNETNNGGADQKSVAEDILRRLDAMHDRLLLTRQPA